MTPQYRNTTTQPFSVTKGKKTEEEEEKTNKDWLVSLVQYSSRAQFLFGCQRSFWPRYFLQMRKKCRLSPP